MELRLHPQEGWALQEKSLATGSWEGDGGVYITSFLEASSWRALIWRLPCVSIVYRTVDVMAAAPTR
jgi:hypothetical protein